MIAGPRLSLAQEEGPTPVAVEVDRAVELGRDESCAVRLEHGGVSRHHARLAFVEGRWAIEDLGSRHGTFVNEERLTAKSPRPLGAGDMIVIGPWRWRVALDGADETKDTTGTTGTAAMTGRADARVVMKRERKSGAETYATRPTIFVRLRADDAQQRELSWQEFHDRYAPVIRGFVRNAGRSGDAADDVIQDVLLGFFQVSPKFIYDPARGRFRGYLKRCTLNALRRRRGGAGAGPALSIDDLDPAEDAATEAPWEAAWAERLFERAADAVAGRVDAKTFEAFDLYARRGMPADAVAQRLGLTANGVHQAKTRVLKLIREEIEAIRAAEG